MRQRPSKTRTPLNQKQQELAQRESQLRSEMEKLERMIAEAPRVAEETTRRQREELLQRATDERRRLDVSMALHDKRWGEDDHSRTRRGSLRKEKRDGRMIFLLLIIALSAVVIWLVSHLHF
jgi:hypothetical protein